MFEYLAVSFEIPVLATEYSAKPVLMDRIPRQVNLGSNESGFLSKRNTRQTLLLFRISPGDRNLTDSFAQPVIRLSFRAGNM